MSETVTPDVMKKTLETMGAKAKTASRALATLASEAKNRCLEQMAREIESARPEILAAATGWEVVNRGENGRRIPAGAQFPPDAGLVIIMLGGNDLLQGLSLGGKTGFQFCVVHGVIPPYVHIALTEKRR